MKRLMKRLMNIITKVINLYSYVLALFVTPIMLTLIVMYFQGRIIFEVG